MSKTSAVDWIESRQTALLEHLLELSSINSGTGNLSGVSKVSKYFNELLTPLADESHVINSSDYERVDHLGNAQVENYGDVLSFKKRTTAPIQILLCGHVDTVFSSTHAFQKPVMGKEGALNGPGVADMKGGILVMLTALEAFEMQDSSSQLGWQVLLNADEETGSHGSAAIMTAAAASAHAGMIYEPALADGTLAGARKGSGNFTVLARGLSAHAGREIEKGRNAIMALNEAVAGIASLGDSAAGITVNIARISGGTAFNVVPDQAVCQFNIRCHTSDEQQRLARAIHEILQKTSAAREVTLELSGGFSRPPKLITPANQLLMDWAVECGQSMNVAVNFKPTGGCCDGNNLAAAGLPNIDTLGVRGGKIHTDQEFMLVDSLAERAQLSLHLLNKLSREGAQLAELRSR